MSEISMDQGNLMERKNCTQCKKIVISKVVIKRISLTLRRTMGTLTSTSPRIPDEAVKRSQNFNILHLIRRITSHPQQEAVQNDLDKQQIIQSIQQRVKGCNHGCRKHWDFRDRQRGAEVAMQGVSQPLQYRSHILRMWTSYDTRFGRESKGYLSHPRHILHTEFLHQKEPTTWSQVWKITRMQRILYGESTCKEMP